MLSRAQTEPPSPPPDPLAGIPIQVLDQQQVDLGDHTIIMNRIAPPPLPAATPAPLAFANPQPPPAVLPKEKRLKAVCLSVDSRNQLFTEVRVHEGSKPDLRIHLNVDLRLLSGVSQLQTIDAFYTYILAFAFDSADAEVNADPLDLTASLPERASYAVTAGNAADYPDALSGLDALCAYFDANRAQLVTDYRKRRDDAEVASNPPPAATPTPRDTVVTYWPVKGSVYLPSH